MKFKVIIFDLDGTIADTLPLCIAAFKKSIQPFLTYDLTEKQIIETFGPSEEGTIRKLVPAHEEEAVKAYLRYYEELHYTCPAPFAGIKELLDYLNSRRVQLAMVTGKGKRSADISLEKFGLREYFGILETGSSEGPVKVIGIRNVLSRLELDAAEALYVGDTVSDVRFCRQIGIPIAAAAWAGTADVQELQKSAPDHLFLSVTDFKSWIENYKFSPPVLNFPSA